MMMPVETDPDKCVAYRLSGTWFALGRDPVAAAWGRGRPPPPPPRPDHLKWVELVALVLGISALVIQFYDALHHSSVVVLSALALLRTTVLVLVHATTAALFSSSPSPFAGTALALLPTCPARDLGPPMCYEWQKLPATMVPPGSSSASNDSWSDEQDDDYKAAMTCFDSFVRDAGWWSDEQDEDYYKATMECFDSVVRDAARTCFVWSYDTILQALLYDDPPPT